MAKQKLVAKIRFDDGTKKGENGKSTDYEIGQAYMGDADQAAAAKKAGFICSESELSASQEVLDEKDRTIRALEDKVSGLIKENQELQKEIDALKGGDESEKPVKKTGGRKPKNSDESNPENAE